MELPVRFCFGSTSRMILLPKSFAFLPLLLFCSCLTTAVEGEAGDPYLYGEGFTYLEIKPEPDVGVWMNWNWLKSEQDEPLVFSADIRSDSQRPLEADFTWRFFSTPGDRSVARIDPKAGECVKYGDEVYIENIASGTDGVLANTLEPSPGEFFLATGADDYKWILRSNPGSGIFDVETDPAFGLCIGELDGIYIQSREEFNRWVKGRSYLIGQAPPDVYARALNFNEESDAERTKYRWIPRRDQAFTSPVNCAARDVIKGYWKPVRFISIPETVTVTVTETRTEEIETTQLDAWSASVEATVNQGWNLFGQAGGISVTVGAEFTGSLSETARSIVTQTTSTTVTRDFEPGVIWQFTLEMRDVCDPSWEIAMDAIAPTDNGNEPPCCLPGFFADNTNFHGPCVQDSPCSCSDEICQSSNQVPTQAPNGPDDGCACFSGENTVDVLGKGVVRMDQLQAGDYIRSDEQGRYSRVYSFLQKDLNAKTTYLQIYMERRKNPLEVTADHLLFVNDTGRSVRAGQIQIGDKLGGQRVVKIGEIGRQGLYAPATDSGSFAVNDGILASNYIGVLATTLAEQPWVNEHRLAHALFVVQRMVCKVIPSYCGANEEYTKEGFSFWAVRVLEMMKYFNNLTSKYQVVLLAIAVPLLMAVDLVEGLCVRLSMDGIVTAAFLALAVYKSCRLVSTKVSS